MTITTDQEISEIVRRASADDVTPRAPVVHEFVNVFEPVPNGPDSVRRGLDMHLARVMWATGDGYQVQIWSQKARAFVRKFFAPACCIVSRCAISEYSLTGEF